MTPAHPCAVRSIRGTAAHSQPEGESATVGARAGASREAAVRP